MWPSMWIFDRCARFSYLHPSCTLAHYAHLCVFLSLSCFFSPSIVRFQEFPLGVVQVLRPKKGRPLSRSFFPFLLPLSFHHLMKTSITKYIQEYLFLPWSQPLRPQSHMRKGCPWLRVHLKADSLTLLIMIFDLPADHETLSSQLLLALPRRKQALVTQWSVQPWRGPLLQSHGRLAQGRMRACELYFLTSCICPKAPDSLT